MSAAAGPGAAPCWFGNRRKAREVVIGGKSKKRGAVVIGGDRPVAIQSMTLAPTDPAQACFDEIVKLRAAGADLVRVAVPNKHDAAALPALLEMVDCPIVADIHFDPGLAILAMRAGVDKIRVNPGNIRDREQLRRIVTTAKDTGTAIRIGGNSGSIKPREGIEVPENDLYGPDLIVKEVCEYVEMFEGWGHRDLVVSLKTQDPLTTIDVNRRFARTTDLPIHLGVTHAGTKDAAIVKSAVALGTLLVEGIGDTIRVSITGDTVDEVRAAKAILEAAGRRRRVLDVYACPSCGRADVDVVALTKAVEARVAGLARPIRVAVMGCAVNGPGEAEEADFGVAGGRGFGYIMKKGRILAKVPEGEIVDALMKAIEEHGAEA